MTNQELMQMRVRLDALATLTGELKGLQFPDRNNPGEFASLPSPQVMKAVDYIVSGRAWLGHLMGELGVTSPYAKSDGKRVNPKDIEPEAHQADAVQWEQEYTHTQKTDSIREMLRECTNELKNWTEQLPNREAAICRTNAWTQLTEAKTQLGLELGRIRAEYIANNPEEAPVVPLNRNS